MAGAAVALIAIVVLGNLRGLASEIRTDPQQTESAAVNPVEMSITADRAGGSDVDGAGVATSAAGDVALEERARLIPAIYAWDPDVRFVYFRHLSKWM